MSWPDIQENITSCRDGNEISGSNRKVHEINDFFLFQVLMGIPCLAWNQQWPLKTDVVNQLSAILLRFA